MSKSVGLALSGGGFRATAFHLGVLKRLEELGVLPQLDRVSTVSGGSVAGALYALKCSQHGHGKCGGYSVEALISDLRPVLTNNFRHRALFGTWRKTFRSIASVTTGFVSRFPLLSKTLDEDLFDGAMLCEIPPWLQINAVNVLTGKGWKFFNDRAGDYLIGATDKTDSISLADAVMTSAAFPGLVDPFKFKTRWEDLSGDLLDDRWAKPPRDGSGHFSRWRNKFGKANGRLSVPLVDGGLYDNEGLEGLRSSKISHAIYSSTASPESDHDSSSRLKGLLRLVGIMHSRLGDLTRRLAHEMTHGCDPGEARTRMLELAETIRSANFPNSNEIADELSGLANVGWPPRGAQYNAIAPILIHRADLANNRFSKFDPPLEIPPEHRGLSLQLVGALSRVRTDLDSFNQYLIDLLIAQAYFLTDAHIHAAMPELMPAAEAPIWEWALKRVSDANANESAILAKLRTEAVMKIVS